MPRPTEEYLATLSRNTREWILAAEKEIERLRQELDGTRETNKERIWHAYFEHLPWSEWSAAYEAETRRMQYGDAAEAAEGERHG